MCITEKFYERLGREIARGLSADTCFRGWCMRNLASPDSLNDVLESELGVDGDELFALLRK